MYCDFLEGRNQFKEENQNDHVTSIGLLCNLVSTMAFTDRSSSLDCNVVFHDILFHIAVCI